MPIPEHQRTLYSEQDTADKLILPYLSRQFGFPSPDSMDFQAQHTLPLDAGHTGRYDGLFLHGGYPYALMEAKKYAHQLTDEDFNQARNYSLSEFFEEAVPFLIMSNGRDYRFFKKTTELDPRDGRLQYSEITSVSWDEIIREEPGRVSVLLTPDQLVQRLREMKQLIYNDVKALFFNSITNRFDLGKTPHLTMFIERIIQERNIYIRREKQVQRQAENAIQTIALHFTLKVLFIKIVEDLSPGHEMPRIIHNLFPRDEYNHFGGIFGYRVLNGLKNEDVKKALRLYSMAKRFYTLLGEDIARVTYQDIFRYGFNIHTRRYGQLLSSRNYDKFLPTNDTLRWIREQLINIDIRNALIYASADSRQNILGDIYGKLIDEELRNAIGAIYTPDHTVSFMVELGMKHLTRLRGKKIVEPACGSGHFYRLLYRRYVEEVVEDFRQSGLEPDFREAHSEALEHVLGKDIDPFAIQLTLLGIFLEQLKDNVQPKSVTLDKRKRQWKANFYVDCQNSLDPITIDPDRFADFMTTLDPERANSLRDSCKRALNADLIIGNPPYGVDVVKADLYDTVYDLQSNDSYGYFISNAIDRLDDGKRVLYITSSSFLTIKSHLKLRKLILNNCKIIRVIKLHRSTFPGIDIFPVILELEKCSDRHGRDSNFYESYDLWQLHPSLNAGELREIHRFIIKGGNIGQPWPYDPTRIYRYQVRQGAIGTFSQLPIFEGMPSLFAFMNDAYTITDPTIFLTRRDTLENQGFACKEIRGRSILKLGVIAEAKTGLQAGNNRKCYRVAAGIRGGAVAGGYAQVDGNLTISPEEICRLTMQQKTNGILVDDPSHDRHFVPLDKAGRADIEGQILSQYWRPVEFYVDWSQNSVQRMKRTSSARFQNSGYYFEGGVTFSDTGIYSPTFRLGHGGVFDQKASCIFCPYFSREFLLGILCSKLVKYFVKVFINHSVSATVQGIKVIPFAIPSPQQQTDIERMVQVIIDKQKGDPSYDFVEEQSEIDNMVYGLYGLRQEEVLEVENWYARRYPKLRRDVDSVDVDEG